MTKKEKDRFHKQFLKNIAPQWRKIAFVVAKTMEDLHIELNEKDEVSVAEVILIVSKLPSVRTQGEISNWRRSEICRPHPM